MAKYIRYFLLSCCCLIATAGDAQERTPIVSDSSLYFWPLQDGIRVIGNDHQALIPNYTRANYFATEHINFDSARYYATRSFTIARKYDDYEWMGKSKRALSYISLMKSSYLQAKQESLEAIEYFRVIRDSTGMYKTMVNLGIAYINLGLLDESLKVNLELSRYYEEQQDPKNLVKALNNLGAIYQELEDLDHAESYYKKVVAICDTLGNVGASLSSRQNLANLYADEKKYQKAINHHYAIVEMAREANEPIAIIRAYTSLGYTFYGMKEYTLALKYATRAMEEADHIGHKEEDANNLHRIGMAYLALKDFAQAETYLQQAHDLATQHSLITDLADYEEGLYQLYERTGNYQKAFEYYQEYVTAKDKVSGEIAAANIRAVEANFLDQEKKLAVLELQQKKYEDEQKLRRRINYISVSLGVVVVAFIVFFQRQKIALARNQQLLIQNKYNSLRSQMNPHFIFNTLNGVQHQIMKSDKMKAYRHLTVFAETIRLMMHNAHHSFVPLQDETALLKRYIELEQIRFGHAFDYHLCVEDDLLERNPLIPPMLLQPVVENAIIHGLSNKEKTGHLRISLTQCHTCHKSIDCIIEDDGIGRAAALRIKQDNAHQHLSMATENTQERIMLLRKFGYKQSSLTIEDLYEGQQASGTRVRIVIPIKNSK